MTRAPAEVERASEHIGSGSRRQRSLVTLGALGAIGGALAVGPYLLPLAPNPDEPAERHARPGGRFVTALGTRTYVEAAGAEHGLPVMLLHGFGGSTFSWRLTIPSLASAGYRAVALDLRGFGLSDKRFDADYAPAAQAAFVAAVMDELGIERAVVVGHSMGANVGARLALEAPDRVRGLVLVDAAIGPGTRGPAGGAAGPLVAALLAMPPARRLGRVLLRRFATPDRVAAVLRSAHLEPATSVTPDVEAGYLVPQRLADWDLALLGLIRDAGRDPIDARLGSIAVPSLVIWGDRDPWIPRTVGEALHAAIPASAWAVVANSGHLPFEERPDAFMAILLPFLETIA